LLTTSLPVGTDAITASYAGSTNDAASTSNAVGVTVNAVVPVAPAAPAATTTTLAASASSITQGGSETLTATVMAGGTPVTSGLVTFASGSTSIGVAQLNAQGQAVLTTTLLPVGTDAITASYVGSTNDAASTSAAQNVTVSAPAVPPPTPKPTVALSVSSSSVAITAPGQSASVMVTLTPSGGYVGTVGLSCSSGLPAGVTCSATPASVTFTAANDTTAQTIKLTVNTTAAVAALRPYAPQSNPSNPMPMLAGAFWLPGLLAAGAGLRKRSDKGVTSHVGHLLVLLVLLAGVGMMTACGGGSTPVTGSSGTSTGGSAPTAGTPTGTAAVTILASDGAGLNQAITFTLNVQ